MDIKRVNTYDDSRFSKKVLEQHGCYLIDDEAYEVEIISHKSAIVRGKDSNNYLPLIDEFRFNAPHIYEYMDELGVPISSFPPVELIELNLDLIQPSQFYVDEEKLTAVSGFINSKNDIIIQVARDGDKYISLDGHTRLYYALVNGYESVKAVVSDEDNDWTKIFVDEAKKRNIFRVSDMILVNHSEYDKLWNDFCDSIFEKGDADAKN